MPALVISTLCEDGSTSPGPYSLCAPYYAADKDCCAMLLCCRNSHNTASHILQNGKCAINFVNDDPMTFKECVKLSWPGDKPGALDGYAPPYHDFNGITSQFDAHFILRVDHILIKAALPGPKRMGWSWSLPST